MKLWDWNTPNIKVKPHSLWFAYTCLLQLSTVNKFYLENAFIIEDFPYLLRVPPVCPLVIPFQSIPLAHWLCIILYFPRWHVSNSCFQITVSKIPSFLFSFISLRTYTLYPQQTVCKCLALLFFCFTWPSSMGEKGTKTMKHYCLNPEERAWENCH